MIFDTDVFIWLQRGNVRAARIIERTEERLLSTFTYMELLQSALNKQQHQAVKAFLREFDFRTLPLTENIGHRAAVYVEQYALSHSLEAGDALIAATAVENGLTLCTGNTKHFGAIEGLQVKRFVP